MTKITKEVLFTELSIKLAIMDAKLDKLIELAMKPEVTIEPLRIKTLKDILPEDIERVRELFKGLESTTDYDLTKPCQWPNESHTDYLKRIGQYNEAQAVDAFSQAMKEATTITLSNQEWDELNK